MEGFDVVVVGGGTAGCVLAARLSEDPAHGSACSRRGPTTGRWPTAAGPTTCSTRATCPTRTTGRRGGARRSSARAARRQLRAQRLLRRGTPGDYDEWGPGWASPSFAPSCERRADARARACRTPSPRALPRGVPGGCAAPRLGGDRRRERPRASGRRRDDPGQRRRGGALQRGVRVPRPRSGASNLRVVGSALVDRVAFTRAGRRGGPGGRPRASTRRWWCWPRART